MAKTAVFDPVSVFFVAEGAGAEMNRLSTFAFKYFSHVRDVIPGTSACEYSHYFRWPMNGKRLGASFDAF